MYWDANNIYGYAMIQNLPCSGFTFLNQKEINDFDLDSVSENSPIGYILEVDLEHCKELYNSYSDYPLCPEKIEISSDMLSDNCKDIADWYGIKIGSVKKIILYLGDKVKYVARYKKFWVLLVIGNEIS